MCDIRPQPPVRVHRACLRATAEEGVMTFLPQMDTPMTQEQGEERAEPHFQGWKIQYDVQGGDNTTNYTSVSVYPTPSI